MLTAKQVREIKPDEKWLPVEEVERQIIQRRKEGYSDVVFYKTELSPGVITGLQLAGFTVEPYQYAYFVKWEG